eukprot:5356002-Pleurochrysis_carterae.AAC.2
MAGDDARFAVAYQHICCSDLSPTSKSRPGATPPQLHVMQLAELAMECYIDRRSLPEATAWHMHRNYTAMTAHSCSFARTAVRCGSARAYLPQPIPQLPGRWKMLPRVEMSCDVTINERRAR